MNNQKPERSDKKFYLFLAIVGGFLGSMTALFFVFFVLPAAIIFGVVTAFLGNFPGERSYTYYAGQENSEEKILIIPLEGIILGDAPKDDSLFSLIEEEFFVYGYEVKQSLIAAAQDEEIKGVIIEVDSPGGTIFGAEAIYDGIKFYKEETGNPVHAHIKGLGASGAYWAVLSADRISADNGTTIGSIGVLSGPFKFYDQVVSEDDGISFVSTINGIETTYISSGAGKDLGNPYRRLTERELEILQTAVDNSYIDFVERVALERNLENEFIVGEIGAFIYDNFAAEQLDLIDGTINLDAAYQEIARAAGVDLNNVEFVLEESAGNIGYSIVSAILNENRQNRGNFEIQQICSNQRGVLAYSGNVAELCEG